MTRDYRERCEYNDRSRNHAEHFAEPWMQDELEFLLNEFADAKGDRDLELVVAECLGRTIEACRQRYYVALNGKNDGVTIRVTSTTTTRIERICDRCWLTVPLSGEHECE